MHLKHQKVKSSSIVSIARDKEKKLLQVKFTDGSTHEFEGVPDIVFYKLNNAPSVGNFFNSYIKNRYKNRKL
jgi:lysyl-tRNA synthetase, class II